MEHELKRKRENKKSKLVAYILWGLLGGFGMHRFYLRRYFSGLIIMQLTIVSIVMEGDAFANVLSLIIIGWIIFDLFFIPYMVKIVNVELDDKGKA